MHLFSNYLNKLILPLKPPEYRTVYVKKLSYYVLTNQCFFPDFTMNEIQFYKEVLQRSVEKH